MNTNIKKIFGFILALAMIFGVFPVAVMSDTPDKTKKEAVYLHNLKIYGGSGSYAEEYAKDNDIIFAADSHPPVLVNVLHEIPADAPVQENQDSENEIENIEKAGNIPGSIWPFALFMIILAAGLIFIGVIITKKMICELR